jgi:glutathione transport system substrate-binding protein
MVPRGSLTRTLAGIAAMLAALAPLAATAAAPPATGDNARTLTVSLPGPFNGCTFLDAGATPTTDAILDLVRPSAFTTNSYGNLVGAGGPIASAELTSLSPETVVYTIAAHQLWSNDTPFTGADLIAWWHRARGLASVTSDGYRAIKSLREGADGLSVTAVFRSPYADWNLLFRDVEASSSPGGCAVSNLVTRPSLGPYQVTSATPRRIVMVMNRQWGSDAGRYGRLVLVSDAAAPSGRTSYFAGYSLRVDRAQEQVLSAHPWVLSHLGTSSSIEEVTFGPGPPTRVLAVREALSWYLNRQSTINRLWGAVTFSPSVGLSALYAQGQQGYPPTTGSSPTVQTTTKSTSTSIATTPGLADCVACARNALASVGYDRTSSNWLSASGVPLTIDVVEGPTAVDRASAAMCVRDWSAAGVVVHLRSATSDVAAAMSAATGHADVAIFARPTLTTPSYSARSWSGPRYPDAYPGGYTSPAIHALYAQALSNFNPVTAKATWQQLDQAVLNEFWVRPLFTAPSLVEWSNNVSGVTGSLSVIGFVDEITGWNSAVSTTT